MDTPMQKELALPPPAGVDKCVRNRQARRFQRRFLALLALSTLSLFFSSSLLTNVLSSSELSSVTVPSATHVQNLLARCAEFQSKPGVPPEFYSRTESDRFVKGTQPVLIRNATLWTGEDDGRHTVKGDIFLHAGIIQWVGGQLLEEEIAKKVAADVIVVDANGSYVTPG